jgi:predicted CDP-diglyceride synthetase/phosphatidate cytidylyltransferase
MKEDVRQAALNVSGGILVASTMGFLAYLCWGLVNREIALNNKDAMMLVLGVLLAKYSDLIQYFFGSSSSNKKQAETISALADTAKTVAQTAAPTPSMSVSPGEQVTVEGQD